MIPSTRVDKDNRAIEILNIESKLANPQPTVCINRKSRATIPMISPETATSRIRNFRRIRLIPTRNTIQSVPRPIATPTQQRMVMSDSRRYCIPSKSLAGIVKKYANAMRSGPTEKIDAQMRMANSRQHDRISQGVRFKICLLIMTEGPDPPSTFSFSRRWSSCPSRRGRGRSGA